MTETASSPAPDVTITERDMLGAMEVLATSDPDPGMLLVLTDEEIMALDGASALELLGSPYLSQNVVDAESSAAAALRSLSARGMVRPGTEDRENEGEIVSGDGDPGQRPVQLDRRLAGVVTLRRIPEAMVTTARTLSGGSTTLAHYFFPEAGVLEEFITLDGFHHFSVPALGSVPERIQRFVDPFQAADQDGEPETVTAQSVGQSVDADDTRSLSVLTAVTDGAGRQATVFATSERVRVLDNGPMGRASSPSDELQISDVSPAALLAVIDMLIPRPEAESGQEQASDPES